MLVKCALIITVLGQIQAKPAEESFYLETRRAPADGQLPHRVGHDIIANWASDWARQKAPPKVIPNAPLAVRCEPEEQDWDLPKSWTDGEWKEWRTRVRDELRRRRHIDCPPSAVSAPPAVPNPSWFVTTTPAPGTTTPGRRRIVRFRASPRPSEDEVQILQEVEAPIQEVGRVTAQEAARAREQRLEAMSPAGSDIEEVPVEQPAGRDSPDIPSPVRNPEDTNPH